MSEGKIKVSVIIPVYNVEEYLRQCLDSVVAQTINKEEIEVLMINDGSTDSSVDICSEYSDKYPYFKLYNQKNGGSARARNLGLEIACGKYIAYLDSDDRFSPDVLKSTADFFDAHYDEIDILTYKIVPIQKGVRKKTHYRYNIMMGTGVYDLTENGNIYISQTNMNIVVKNKGDENVLFDTTQNFRHEDMMYCTEILRDKKRIGFVASCEYLYERNPQSVVSNFYSATIFDIATTKWEELFDSFEGELPEYIQALFVNDIQWKMKSDILLPYHLEGDDYDRGVGRLRELLRRVDNKVLLNHPECAEMNKYYFLTMKYNGELEAQIDGTLRLLHGDEVLYESDCVNLVLTRLRADGDNLEVCGYLSSPVFRYCEKPDLIIRRQSKLINVELFDSSWCYNDARVKNNQAWGFRYVFDIGRDFSFAFKVEFGERSFNVNLLPGEWTIFDRKSGRNEYVLDARKYRLTESRLVIRKARKSDERLYKIKQLLKYLKTDRKAFLVRFLNLIMPKKQPIWLYNDCKVVGKDNAYYQFKHDFYKDDGVKRYYVVNGDLEVAKAAFEPLERGSLIKFRSAKHKLLYLKADRIITAFVEKINYVPFFDDVYKYYMDLFKGRVVYLQHGVLHAHLPWKYAYDRLDISYEVISTKYEEKNFTENYCFPKESLIKSKMPRFDYIDCEAQPDGNRILLAPSWRKYLISMKGDGSWLSTEDKFLNSDYFNKTQDFLNSTQLSELLEENNWYLDFKPHPIFTLYNKLYTITNPRVRLAEETNQADYKVLMTDYSSFVFDFVYLERSIIYFMPDYKQFKSGMNDYRELDIPFENGFGELTQNTDEAVEALKRIIKNDGKPIPPFDERTKGFFFNKDKDCCEKIYNAINQPF